MVNDEKTHKLTTRDYEIHVRSVLYRSYNNKIDRYRYIVDMKWIFLFTLPRTTPASSGSFLLTARTLRGSSTFVRCLGFSSSSRIHRQDFGGIDLWTRTVRIDDVHRRRCTALVRWRQDSQRRFDPGNLEQSDLSQREEVTRVPVQE